MINTKLKRGITISVVLFLILAVFTGVGSAYTGSGTESDPYILSSPSDFTLFDTYPSAYYELGNDIDCGSSSYGGYCSADGFSGSLDGNNHLIYNDVSGTNGLFAYINGGTVKDLYFFKCTFSGYQGGALAGYVTGSTQTLIDGVSAQYCSISGSAGATSGGYKGGIIGAVSSGNVKIVNSTVENSEVSITSTFTYGSPRISYAGGLIGEVLGSSNNIELGNNGILNTKVYAMCSASGLIGCLNGASFSGLNIHDNVLESVYIDCGGEAHTTAQGIIAHASGLFSYNGATADNPLDIYIKDNGITNSLISGGRGSAGISYEASSGNLRPTYEGNVITKTTIYQTSTSWYNGEATYYAGGFHGNGAVGNCQPSYNGNELTYLTVYSAKAGAQQYSTYYIGVTNLFAPTGLSYSSFISNKAVYCDLGSAGSVSSRVLPSSSSGNEYHDIDGFTSYLNLTGINIQTDSENMRARTFIAVQRGAVLTAENSTYAGGFGVIPQYKWDYTGDGTVDTTTNTYYATYTYPSDGEYHPTLTASLLSLSTNIQTSTNLSTLYLGAPKFVSGSNILKSADIQTYGENVRLTANMVTGYGGATYEFFYSTDGGNTWSSYASASPYTYKDITYISSSEETTFVKYKVVATNTYGSTTSDILNFLWTPSTTISDTVTELSLTSSDDTYGLNFSVTFPFETVKTYSFSSYYTVTVTKNAVYLLQNNVANTSQVIKAKLENYDSYIVDSDFYDGQLVYRTDDDNAYYTYITEDLGFASLQNVPFLGDNVSQVSVSRNAYLVRSISTNTEYVECYAFNSNTSILTLAVVPYTYTNWRILSFSSDSSNTPAVVCSYANGNNKIVRCYTGQNTYYDSEEFTANTITSIKPFLGAGKIVLTTNNGKSFMIPYTLTSSSFSWGNVISADDITLTDVTPTYYDVRYIGINAPSTVVFISSSSGQLDGQYPISSTLTSVDISGTSGIYAIAGDYNGRIMVMWNNNGEWEGLQSTSVGHTIVDTSISHDYLSLSACSLNTVYLGTYQNYTTPSTDTVLTTKIYIKVIVHNANGAIISDTPVTLIGESVATTMTTDSDGSATFEVTAGSRYTIQTNGITQSYVADNQNLKIINIYITETDYRTGLTFNSSEANNIITTSFTGNGKETYTITYKVFDANNTVLTNTTVSGTSQSFTLNKSQYNSSTLTVSISVVGQTSGITDSRSYVYHNYEKSEKGYMILGDIPILPDMLDSNWVKFLFGGLLMVIGGLFSAQHSAKGSIIVVVIASFLTWTGILPLNPVWIGCLVVLAILTLYSFASSRET